MTHWFSGNLYPLSIQIPTKRSGPLDIIQDLFKNNVKINILNMGVIDNTPTGQLIFTIFSAFAQFERDMIITRTQDGKEYAKKFNPNYRDGRPNKFTVLLRSLKIKRALSELQIS